LNNQHINIIGNTIPTWQWTIIFITATFDNARLLLLLVVHKGKAV